MEKEGAGTTHPFFLSRDMASHTVRRYFFNELGIVAPSRFCAVASCQKEEMAYMLALYSFEKLF